MTLCVFQALFDWVDIAGGKLASMSPIGTDLETVKQQIEELKEEKKKNISLSLSALETGWIVSNTLHKRSKPLP